MKITKKVYRKYLKGRLKIIEARATDEAGISGHELLAYEERSDYLMKELYMLDSGSGHPERTSPMEPLPDSVKESLEDWFRPQSNNNEGS